MSALYPTPELMASVVALYATFQHYPLRQTTNPCMCCHSAEDEKPLHAKPLRRLGKRDLYLYATEALLVWGDADDFRHFLPRIFELLITEDDRSFVDPETVLSKLRHSQWRAWAKEEQESIERFLAALWDAALAIPPSEDPCAAISFESWLCAIAQAEDDLSIYLGKWLQSSVPAATWNLALMIADTGLAQPGNPKIDPWWQDNSLPRQQVSEWLRSEVVRKKLEAGVDLLPNEAYVSKLRDALYIVS